MQIIEYINNLGEARTKTVVNDNYFMWRCTFPGTLARPANRTELVPHVCHQSPPSWHGC